MTNKKNKIVYVGFSDELIRLLLDDNRYDLDSVVTMPGRISKKTRTILRQNSIIVNEVSSKQELQKIFLNIHCDIVLMYKFGLIIPKQITEKWPFFNIHPGDIRTNRGGHPLRWTILLGERKTKITLYQIDGIDEGIIVDEIQIIVSDDEDVITLEEKMNKQLLALLNSLYSYCENNSGIIYKTVKGGVYRRKIIESDYRIDLQKDNYDTIRRKIACVKDFGGATIEVNKKLFRVYDVSIDNNKCVRECNVVKKNNNGKTLNVYYEEYNYI